MDNSQKLKCTDCGGDLELQTYFDGCDWDSVKGEGSGFEFGISLKCECGRMYPLGRLKKPSDFCENIEKLRPYGAQNENDGGGVRAIGNKEAAVHHETHPTRPKNYAGLEFGTKNQNNASKNT